METLSCFTVIVEREKSTELRGIKATHGKHG